MKTMMMFAVLILTGCSFLNPNTGEEMKGVPVAIVAELAHDLGNKIELYDVNKDGFITEDEAVLLGLAYGQSVYQAILKYNLENPETVPEVIG